MKNLKNLGKALSKAEQQSINGGRTHCNTHFECGPGQCCKGDITSDNGYCGRALDGDSNNCEYKLEFLGSQTI